MKGDGAAIENKRTGNARVIARAWQVDVSPHLNAFQQRRPNTASVLNVVKDGLSVDLRGVEPRDGPEELPKRVTKNEQNRKRATRRDS